MGMPITSYDMINVLDGGGDEYETIAVKEALKPFNLFAFIIHNPEVHTDFEQKISGLFDYLDHLTGDKLLFFALVDPPEEWLRHGSSRSYYEILSQRIQQLRSNATISANKDMTAFSLAYTLGIPYEKLPCLVISPDFRSEDFMWLRTCAVHVEEQLRKLGYIATGRAGNILNGSFADVINAQGVNLCEGSGSVSLGSALAKALADFLSFVPDKKERTSTQSKRVQNTIEKLNASLKDLKKRKRKKRWKQTNYQANYDADNKTELDDRLENDCMKIAVDLAHLNPQPNLNLGGFVNINRQFLENDSYQILKTASLVLDVLHRPSQFIPGFKDEESPFDFAPGVMCLAKMFEKEINLSVVHWIRQSFGIEMPNYFNRYRPQLPKDRTSFDGVNFNMVRDESWYPPETGKSLRALQAAAKNSNMRQQLNKQWISLLNNRVLFNNWEIIKEQRNIAGHNKVVKKESVNAVQCALNNLSQEGIFEVLYNIKSAYRS